MSQTQRTRNLIRYRTLVNEVIATLGQRDGTRWLLHHRALAKRGISQLEATWALEQYRLQTTPTTPPAHNQ